MPTPERLVPGLQDDPERRYTYAGKVAHLIAYGHDYSAQPYTSAYCGFSPQWGSAWLGSGSQTEIDEANRLPICKRCMTRAQETADFIAGLKADLDARAASQETPGPEVAPGA